jgi:hypothetical protein
MSLFTERNHHFSGTHSFTCCWVLADTRSGRMHIHILGLWDMTLLQLCVCMS